MMVMNKQQEDAFWDIIKAFDELGLLQHIMVIGSWAEYLYPPLFKTDFVPNVRTRDVDFFYCNINVPREKLPLIDKLKEYGFLHDIDHDSEVSRFYKEDLLELEFLTRALGSAGQSIYPIRALGIKSEGLRIINILADYACEIEANGYKITVPEPSVYVIQKILANPTRIPKSKREKDMFAVNEILEHIIQSDYHMTKLKEICSSLTKKQTKTIYGVIEQYPILLKLKGILNACH